MNGLAASNSSSTGSYHARANTPSPVIFYKPSLLRRVPFKWGLQWDVNSLPREIIFAVRP